MLEKGAAIQYLGEAISSLATDNLTNSKYEYAENRIQKALSIVKRHNEKQ